MLWAIVSFFGILVLGKVAQTKAEFVYWPTMVFASMLFFTYLVSGTYHLFPHGKWAKDVLQRIDHAMIYFLIVGTHHAVVHLVLRDENSIFWLKILWGVAGLGAIIKLTRVPLPWWLSITIYVALGIIAVVKLNELFAFMEIESFLFLVAGGGFYLLGVIFFVWEELRGKDSEEEWLHVIFHIFIILGGTGHFLSILLYLFQLGSWIDP